MKYWFNQFDNIKNFFNCWYWTGDKYYKVIWAYADLIK